MTTVIEPSKSRLKIDWRELFAYRDLLFLLVKRDLVIVYKQTFVGPVWFLIQPLLSSAIFAVIFGRVAKISTDGVPHLVFYMSGMVIWTYFQGVMQASGSSLIANARILTKVYFPRLIVPIAGIFSNIVHLMLNMVMFLVVYFIFFFTTDKITPTWWLLLFPVCIAYAAYSSFAFGLWIAALTIKYRDLRLAIPFLLQMWMYVSPIVYPASAVANSTYKLIIFLNPVTVAVEFNRLMFLGKSTLSIEMFLVGLAISTLVFLTGLAAFNKVERTLADTI